MRQRPWQPSSEKLLLVEGKTTKLVLEALTRAEQITGIEIHDFGGGGQLKGFLKALVAGPGFRGVRSLGIVKDAEENPTGWKDSIRSACTACHLPVPAEENVRVPGDPSLAFLLLPHDGRTGMIETVCLDSVSDDPAMPCVHQFFECLTQTGIPSPANLHKARAQAFLASRAQSALAVGHAAQEQYWNFQHVAFAPLREFLRAM